MKILLVHEYYRSSSPSGEDRVFEQERDLLIENGEEVNLVKFRNDDIGTPEGPSLLKTAISTPWSIPGAKMLNRAIKKFQPDIVHFHNTFPFISQSAIFQAKKFKLPTVQTFHNFRSICAQALLMYENTPCDKCMGRYPWPAIINRCYRNSLISTLPLAANIALNRLLKTWQTKVDRLIVLSDFNKNKFIEAGFPENKIRVKPNFFYDNPASDQKNKAHEKQWAFIGRLQEEKGAQFIVPVWKKMGHKAPILNIVGDGPLREQINKDIQNNKLQSKIILHGLCTKQQVNIILRESNLLFFPSICYEGFPLVIGEAYTEGVAVACAKIGTTGHIVKNLTTGIHFQPGNTGDMVEKLLYLIDNPGELEKMGKNARQEYEKKYTPSVNINILLDIYKEAIQENSR